MPKPHDESHDQSNFNDYALRQAEQRVGEVRGDVEFYQRKLAEVEDLIRKDEAKIHNFEALIKASEQKLSALQKSYEKDISDLQVTATNLRGEAEKADQEKKNKTQNYEDYHAIQQKIIPIEENIGRLKEEKSTLKSRTEKIDVEVAEISKRIALIEGDKKYIETKAGLESALDSLKEKQNSFIFSNFSSYKEKEGLKGDIAVFARQLATVGEEVNGLQKTLEGLVTEKTNNIMRVAEIDEELAANNAELKGVFKANHLFLVVDKKESDFNDENTKNRIISFVNQEVKSTKVMLDTVLAHFNKVKKSLDLTERNVETLKKNQVEDMGQVSRELKEAKASLSTAKFISDKDDLIRNKHKIQADLKSEAQLLREAENKLKEINVEREAYKESLDHQTKKHHLFSSAHMSATLKQNEKHHSHKSDKPFSEKAVKKSEEIHEAEKLAIKKAEDKANKALVEYRKMKENKAPADEAGLNEVTKLNIKRNG